MEEKQIYGLGEQDFKVLRDSNQVYIDKTQYIPTLLEKKYYFLSRPRRFGKSLFLSTLEQFFKGNKELFNGLAVENHPWEWVEYPVVKVSFSQGSFTKPNGLQNRMEQILFYAEEEYGLEARFTDLASRFSDLLKRLFEKFERGVVILIDEYEKPLLDSYGKDTFEENRETLSDFYSVFKDNSPHIRFLFITGVTRFGHLNIFSGLNNLVDISLSIHYSGICGITEQEISDCLMPGVKNFASSMHLTLEDALRKLKYYYDGYHFSAELLDIYNPWTLLNCLNEGRITPQWMASGSSRYLLDLLQQRDYNLDNLEGEVVSEEVLLGLESDFLDPITLLYQSGYLTIKENIPQDLNYYRLGIPNNEVKIALYNAIIPYYLGSNKKVDPTTASKLFRYIQDGHAEELMEWFASFFSKISYASKLKYERDFQYLVFLVFALIKELKDIHFEYTMSSGRIDLLVEAEKYVYLFEFKLGEDAEKALAQIDFRGYALPWSADGRKVYKIGAAFSTRNNGILSYRIEEA